jgi:hypothetical protein
MGCSSILVVAFARIEKAAGAASCGVYASGGIRQAQILAVALAVSPESLLFCAMGRGFPCPKVEHARVCFRRVQRGRNAPLLWQKEVRQMPKEKQHVFSARTTEGGLKTLNELKKKLGVNWDGLVIDAVNAHYGVDVPRPPRAERKPKAEKPKKKPKNKKS